MSFNVTLKEPYLSQIASGLKTVEGRINSGQFTKIHRGDLISFYNRTCRVECKVTGVFEYRTFKGMLEGEGLEKCLPGCKNLEEGVRIYESIPGYAQRAKQYGVVAIRLLKLENLKRKREDDGIN